MNTRKKIVIIDDEEDIIEILSYSFRRKGFDVYGAVDGIQGLSIVESVKPDIIISDLFMPHMSGINMCKQLKTNNQLKDIPFVFLTAASDEDQKEIALEAGAERYISKPIALSKLSEVINEILLKKQ